MFFKIIKKKIFLIGFALLVVMLTTVVLVQAQEEQVCGDGVVQLPERCDEGTGTSEEPQPLDTPSCTAQCGQKMLGWAWADNFGWLSLNDDNCLATYLDPSLDPSICEIQPVDYYLQINIENKVSGWAWSDNIGWVCFGETCSGLPVQFGTASPPDGWTADLDFDDPDSPQVIGWAKALTLADDGWISLNCLNDNSCDISDYKVRLTLGDFDGTCSISGERCTPGCVFPADPYCCDDAIPSNTCVAEQWPTLSGWGWNGNTSGPALGWVWFDPDISGILPWLQTKYGDIYAGKGLSGVEAPGYNATYRILANGAIDRFRSAQGIDLWVDENFGPINFPTPETRYSNILGQLDVEGLICDFGAGQTCINKYGKTVKKISDQSGLEQPLGGKIYYRDGNLSINSPIEFINAAGFVNGAGTVIVNGNLAVNVDTAYDNSDALTRFRNLATVAWIVKGDLQIGPNVKELAGNFIVIGNGVSACDPDNEVPGCGQIYSCYNSAQCGNRLQVSGLMMARKFYFGRTFTDRFETPAEGSEIIIYDGRLLANIPPGLGDFAQSLPIWRSEIFSQ